MKETKLRSFLFACFCVEFSKWLWVVIWLRHVTWVGVIGVSVVMASYQLIWFLCFWKTKQVYLRGKNAQVLLLVVWLALVWVAMEWLRSSPFGVPGATLAVTQWQYPSVLSVCSYGGGYLLSAFVVMVNLAFANIILRLLPKDTRISVASSVLILMGVGGFVISSGRLNDLLYGSEPSESVSVKVAVVQPNQPPYRVWNRERIVQAMEEIFRLSRSVSSEEFDLMVWPEGTLPYPVSKGNSMDQEVEFLVQNYIQSPLLWGNHGIVDEKHINGVFLHDKDGRLSDLHYAKRFLVPFGEFIPFRSFFSFLETIVPIGTGFTRGEKPVSFTIQMKDVDVNISPLICYEDCFPELAIDCSKSGADLIFVATYDGWYGEENGAITHAAHSVLRAAETRLPVLRCGSSGWSGYIDESGRIAKAVVSPDEGSIYFRGVEIIEIEIPLGQKRSIYTTLPNWIRWIVVGLIVIGIYLFQIPNRSLKFTL